MRRLDDAAGKEDRAMEQRFHLRWFHSVLLTLAPIARVPVELTRPALDTSDPIVEFGFWNELH
jgi:hypothetical protein